MMLGVKMDIVAEYLDGLLFIKITHLGEEPTVLPDKFFDDTVSFVLFGHIQQNPSYKKFKFK